MPMGDLLGVIVETEDSSSSHPTSGSCISTGLQKFLNLLKKIACSNVFTFILITLSLATPTISMYVCNNILFKSLPFFLPQRLPLLLLLVCCTCTFSRLIVTALIFSVERHYVMKTDKALSFIFALKKSVAYFLYCSSLLLSWMFFIKSDMTGFVVHSVTSTLATVVIAIGMWMLKIVILKVLDCRFHDKDFFPNIQDLILHEYILQTLLGPSRGSENCNNCTMRAQLKRIKGTFANMLLFCTRLHTICSALDNGNFDEEHQIENLISKVYKNLTNKELRDIQETDLLLVMKEEDILKVLRLFEGATERKNISEASLRKWMVKVCSERKLVVHLLNNTSNVIQQLNKIVLLNLSLLVALVWCLLMGNGTSKYLGYISSTHLLVLAYMSGDYCKIICEGIMQSVVMHPFDIGDHCIIDNEQLVVEEMGLTYTVFLKENNEKINCPNSALLTKSVSNLSQSSGLKYNFELLVSSLTSLETIAALKLKIIELLQSMAETWHAEYSFYLEAIDNVTHIYNLEVARTKKFQNYNDRRYLRSELVLRLRKHLDELDIQNFSIK